LPAPKSCQTEQFLQIITTNDAIYLMRIPYRDDSSAAVVVNFATTDI
jgi:hypothetical protein